MSAAIAPTVPGRVIGIIDLGSNSVRLLLVRIFQDGNVAVLNQVKHMVRLGEGGFLRNRLQEETMSRTITVLRGFADMCTVYGAAEIIAIATAAVRDAENGPEFIRRVQEKTGILLTAISGREEARRIYRGVSSGMEPDGRQRLFIDIGGGSTELIAADSELRSLDSLKLGCVRLANLFFEGDRGPVSAYRYATLQRYVRNESLHALQRLGAFDPVEAVGSSGTIQNLAEIAAAREQEDLQRTGKNKGPISRTILRYDTLCRVVRDLCAMTLEERRSVPGMNPNRADVIIPGAAILQTLMEEQGFESLRVSNRNLQNGILADYLMRTRPETVRRGSSVREDSVLQLARYCRFEEVHSRHVTRLALELFDSARELGLHAANAAMRELLRHASLLHDIGIFIAFSKHHAHSYYLIRNTELLGFTEREIEIMAATAYFHRKRPSRKSTLFLSLDEGIREEVRLLSLFLTLAERLDRSHCQVVETAAFRRGTGGLELHMHAATPCPIEIEEVERCRKLLRKRFKEAVTLIAHIDKDEKDQHRSEPDTV